MDRLMNELAGIITRRQPFGPPDAAQYSSHTDLLRLLYDPTNRIHQQAESTGAPYVIGRKGAGKTAFVMAPKLRPNSVAVELPSADIYQGVFGIVRALHQRGVEVYAEHSARLWRQLAWSAVLCEIARREGKRKASTKTIFQFAEFLGNGRVPSSPDQSVSLYLERVERTVAVSARAGGLGELITRAVSGYGWTINDAIDEGARWLAACPDRYVVIVDSLERYTGSLPRTPYESVERNAFEGLFRFIGGDGTMPDRSFDIRFAFPAELWSVLEHTSSNPIKDFHQRVIAQWSSRELIALIGTRLAIYTELYEPELKTPRIRNGDRVVALNYDDARRMIAVMLPPTVTNGMGIPEDTVAYLLRHTQLLPRHLITILNQIWEVHATAENNLSFPVGNHAIVEGVRHGETDVVGDIIAAYKQVHPFAKLCCERVIPNLGMVFAEGDLHREYNRNGIRRDTGLEFRDFERSLIEIGCVGRTVESERTARYVVGEFEYTRPGSLYIGDGELFCLHPVFAEVFSCRNSTSRLSQLSPEERSTVRPVYPIGTDPDAKVDYRDAV
jgi:hypothetical protein